MERLAYRQEPRNGMSRSHLRLWGLLFAGLGITGKAIIQNRLLGMGSISSAELLQAMMDSQGVMVLATLALVLQAVEVCALPVFCCLLVEGVEHTRNLGLYFLRVLGVAVLSELPYNLAMSGSLWDLSSRNPVFGLALALGMLLLCKQYAGKNFSRRALRVLIAVAAILWPMILNVQDGTCTVILVLVLWLSRNRKQMRTFLGCGAAAMCSLLSPYYLAAPMGFLVVHFYRGHRSEENKAVNYLAYPALLLAAGLAGNLLI